MKQEQLSPRGQAGPPESLGVPTAQETSVLRGKAGPITFIPRKPKAQFTTVSSPLKHQEAELGGFQTWGPKSCVLHLLGTALGSTASGSITKGLPSTRAADGPSYRGSITHVGSGGRMIWPGVPSGLGWEERTSRETRDSELKCRSCTVWGQA